MQNDQSLAIHVREFVSAAIYSLVTSCVERVQYPDLENVCRYVQYKKEYARFLAERESYNAKVTGERQAAMEQARSLFKVQESKCCTCRANSVGLVSFLAHPRQVR